MRAHIHFDRHGWPQSVNNYLAMDGFQQMGWEIVPYTDTAPVQAGAPDEIVVGHIAAVRAGPGPGGARRTGLPQSAAPVSGPTPVAEYH